MLDMQVLQIYRLNINNEHLEKTQNMVNKLYDIISKVMKISPSQINDRTGPENIENWDSFNGLVLVDKLELEFKIKFTLEEIQDVKNISDIKRHLRNHGVKIE